MGGANSVWASTVDDLATISADHSVAFADIMNAAKLNDGTLYDSNYLLSVGGNNYASNKGTNATISKLNCCRVKSATQDRLAFKVGGACTLKIYAQDVEERKPFLSTNGTTSAVTGSYSSGTTTFTIPAAGTYYIVGMGSDYFLAGLEFTFPSGDAPTITKQPVSATYEVGDAATALSVTASASAGTLQYEWYSNTSATTEGATKVQDKSTTVTYTPSTSSAATTYYYCKVYDTNGNTDSEFATVKVVNAIAPVITYSAPAVTITCAGAGTIYYTTDGSVPSSSNGTEYSAPFNLTNSCTVRAVAEKGGNSSDLVKYDCYVDQSSAEGFLISTGNHSGTNSGSTWSSTDGKFTLSKTIGDFNWSNGLFPGMHGHKMDNGTTYTLQPIEGIKITSIKIVGRTWLNGTAATVAVSDATPSSDTWLAGETGNVSYILTKEFAISADYGEAVTITPTGNQFGCFLEVYGDLKTYTITYNKGTYGSGTIDAGVKTYGTDFTLSSSTFTRAGYIQTGWATSDGGVQLYTLGGTYTANADVTLYPVWAEISSITAFNYTDGKTISQLEALGWTFNSAIFDADPADGEAYVNLVSAFTAVSLTAPGANSMAANAIAFAKSTSAYAMYDLGEAKTITAVNTTLYGGSGSSFNATIEYVGADGSTVMKSYSTIALNAGNWMANNISLTDEVSGVRYIKVYGATKWIVMYNLSVTYKESLSVGTKSGRNYASYVTSQKLDFSAADGITAYIATGLNGSSDAVVLKSVDIVPAGVPIIVKTDTKGATVNVPVTTADASDVSGNNLVAGDGTTAWNGTAGYTYYYLASDQFHEATSGTLQSGKAYLKVGGSGARQLSIVFGDDEVTGIADVRDEMGEVNDNFFDLSGRKVAQPTKGLYIVNGKKVIIK